MGMCFFRTPAGRVCNFVAHAVVINAVTCHSRESGDPYQMRKKKRGGGAGWGGETGGPHCLAEVQCNQSSLSFHRYLSVQPNGDFTEKSF